jgi:alkylation response protein AidB-like acyl-CoA dehydrogenase
MKMQGNWSAGTAHVFFEDVRVPESQVGAGAGGERGGGRSTM